MARTRKARTGSQPAARPLVLVGLMGVGKSTVGRRLAKRLALPFVDADAEIEKAAGCPISDIFEFHGEAAFREGERRVLRRLLEERPAVIATGGGAFIDDETRRHVRQHATSIWLRTDLDTVVKRVKRNTNRPLLRNGDPRKTLEHLMEVRDPIYAEADIVVDSSDTAVDKVVDAIVDALKTHETESS